MKSNLFLSVGYDILLHLNPYLLSMIHRQYPNNPPTNLRKRYINLNTLSFINIPFQTRHELTHGIILGCQPKLSKPINNIPRLTPSLHSTTIRLFHLDLFAASTHIPYNIISV